MKNAALHAVPYASYTMMRNLLLLFFIATPGLMLSGCAQLNALLKQQTVEETEQNPLKTLDDNRIEKLLVGGKWMYQREEGDCKDTYWAQHFYKNKYYKSGGSTCLLKDSFSLDAESWHVKNRVLYIINLSPRNGEDVILKYGVSLINDSKLVLLSGQYSYTFIRE